MSIIIILLLLALAVYEREKVAAIAFGTVLLFCLQPQYSPPVLSDVHVPQFSTTDVMRWNGSAWEDGQVLVSNGDDTYTFESGGVDGGWPRNQHRDSVK